MRSRHARVTASQVVRPAPIAATISVAVISLSGLISFSLARMLAQGTQASNENASRLFLHRRHRIDSLSFGIAETVIDEALGLPVQCVEVEALVPRFPQQEPVQECDRDVAIGTGL